MKLYMLAISSGLLLATAAPAFAASPPECRSGEKLVSFLDGDDVSYSCVEDTTAMEATVEDLSQEGQVDPNNYD